MNITHQSEHTVGEHFVIALEYSEPDGLTKQECSQLEGWLAGLWGSAGVGDFDYSESFYGTCGITGEWGRCVTATYTVLGKEQQ